MLKLLLKCANAAKKLLFGLSLHLILYSVLPVVNQVSDEKAHLHRLNLVFVFLCRT